MNEPLETAGGWIGRERPEPDRLYEFIEPQPFACRAASAAAPKSVPTCGADIARGNGEDVLPTREA
eukprot:6918558-Prymnesium_polylepis.2